MFTFTPAFGGGTLISLMGSGIATNVPGENRVGVSADFFNLDGGDPFQASIDESGLMGLSLGSSGITIDRLQLSDSVGAETDDFWVLFSSSLGKGIAFQGESSITLPVLAFSDLTPRSYADPSDAESTAFGGFSVVVVPEASTFVLTFAPMFALILKGPLFCSRAEYLVGEDAMACLSS